jgi:uncharacterized metal-binding protein YceD (DUF177 family)
MEKKMFVIPFRGLKEGEHQFEYIINNAFFEVYQYEDILDADINVHLNFVKKSTLLELSFIAKGEVQVTCDISNELFFQPIEGRLDLVIKFGEEYNNDNEDILIIPYGDFEIDIAQYIYEMIVLSLPVKKIHPGIIDGTLKTDILDKLEELQPNKEQNNNSIDPRWDKLKGL